MTRDLCACGRDAVEVVRVATDDGVLLVPMCADCVEIGDAGDAQGELFGRSGPRRPLAAMPPRDLDAQPPLPLDEAADVDEERGAA
jgi:hypothetical protein